MVAIDVQQLDILDQCSAFRSALYQLHALAQSKLFYPLFEVGKDFRMVDAAPVLQICALHPLA
jgi:hypothetical protein